MVRDGGEQIDGSFQHDGTTYLVEAKWHRAEIVSRRTQLSAISPIAAICSDSVLAVV
jgi:hypothetical protein